MGIQLPALIIGCIGTIIAISISVYSITCHLIQTRHETIQTYTIRILLMVPINTLEAMIAISVPQLSVVLAVFRSCYEAFTLFSFVQLMLSYLTLGMPSQGDGARGAIWIALDMKSDPQVSHVFPCSFLPAWPMGPVFLRRTLMGVFQYSATMPLIALLTGICQALGAYGASVTEWNSAYPYLFLIQNASQCWALYCLVLFYRASAQRLEAKQPLRKFVCIKMVVFFTWWQDMMIAGLVYYGAIGKRDVNGDGVSTEAEAAALLSNLIITVEMAFMAHVFRRAFPPSDYEAGSSAGTRYILTRRGDAPSFLGDALIENDDPEVVANPTLHLASLQR